MSLDSAQEKLEAAILCAAMTDGDALIRVLSSGIRKEHFQGKKHAEVWDAITSIHEGGGAVDVITVSAQLKIHQAEATHVDAAEISTAVTSGSNVESHCHFLIENWKGSEIKSISSWIDDNALDVVAYPDRAITYIESKVSDISRDGKRSLVRADEVAIEVIKDAHELHSSGEVSGLPTTIGEVTKILGGWQKSDLIIVAARPGMGKTSYMTQEAANTAKQGTDVLINSLEMPARQIVQKIISQETGIQNWRNGIDARQYEMASSVGFMDRIYIDDTPSLAIEEFRRRSHAYKLRHPGLGLIVGDYLQLFRTEEKYGNRDQQVGAITGTAKAVAKELDIPVIFGSQLSRSCETRGGDKRPMLSDLRESGNIEQDADIVAFLYRPKYYGLDFITIDDQDIPSGNKTLIDIAKHRNGAPGEVWMDWIPSQTLFIDAPQFD